MQDRDTKTLGYVLRRTNYGEADRILNIITPLGKVSAIAKGVRKERSKLAGGVEMFTLSEYNFHKGKSELATVTGVKMKKYYGEIVKDLARMELGGMILKMVNSASENSDSLEFFDIVDQSLKAINDGRPHELVTGWFLMNLQRAIGEDINLFRDKNGDKLVESENYDWDYGDSCFTVSQKGEYSANDIKMLRLVVTAPLEVVSRVKCSDEMLSRVSRFAKIVAKI